MICIQNSKFEIKLISYNVNIRSLVKIGAVRAFHFQCELIQLFCLIRSVVRDALERAARIIVQYSRCKSVVKLYESAIWYIVYSSLARMPILLESLLDMVFV